MPGCNGADRDSRFVPTRKGADFYLVYRRKTADQPFTLDEVEGEYQDIDTRRTDIFTCGSYGRSHKERHGFHLWN